MARHRGGPSINVVNPGGGGGAPSGSAGGDLTGTYPNPTLASGAVDLAGAEVTGIVGAANGGTGRATLTSGSFLTGNGTGTVNLVAVPIGVANGGTGAATLTGVLKGNGTSAVTAAQLAVADGGTGAGTLTGLVVGNGTSAFTTVTAPSGTVVGTSDTQTLTNKRVTRRVSALTDASTVSWNTDNADVMTLLATSGVGATRALSNSPTGTPSNGDILVIEYQQDGTGSRAFTTGTAVTIPTDLGGGTTFPTDSAVNKCTLLTLRYSTVTSKWILVGVLRGY